MQERTLLGGGPAGTLHRAAKLRHAPLAALGGLALLALGGCGSDDAGRTRQHSEIDAAEDCGCEYDADCGDQPDGFTDPEDWGFSADPVPWPDAGTAAQLPKPAGEPLPRYSPLAPEAGLPAYCNDDGTVKPGVACLGQCGAQCSGVAGFHVCTEFCRQHDCCIRTQVCQGVSKWRAHCSCLGVLFSLATASLSACTYLWMNNSPLYATSCICDDSGALPAASCP